MTPNALPDAAIVRFRADLIACGASLDQRFGLCISGGPDSIALLLLAHHAGLEILAATVDHGLRQEAGEEAQFVAGLCAELGIAHQTIRLSEQPVGNISDWARSQRYLVLNRWADDNAIDLLLTAHHADDQLETILMRLNRASGVAGLSGIRKRQNRVMRPLLSWRKQELLSLVQVCQIEPVDDPSNGDDRFDRARLRKRLAGIDWLDPLAVAKSAEALASVNEAVDWTVTMLFATYMEREEGGITCQGSWISTLPTELQRRLVLASLTLINADANPRSAALERLIVDLHAGRTTTLADVKCAGGTKWRFSRAASRRTK